MCLLAHRQPTLNPSPNKDIRTASTDATSARPHQVGSIPYDVTSIKVPKVIRGLGEIMAITPEP
jgi:hypothetical protein